MNAFPIPAILALEDAYQIFQKVCYTYGKDIQDVLVHNKSRKRDYVEIRQISMYLFMNELGYSYNQAGDCFLKDDATARHAEKTISNLLETDKFIKIKMSKIISHEL
jgi:chromosomal replication initiator protein